MTRIKNLAAMALMAVAALFTSCGEEEYKQLYLYDTESKTRITNGSELNLYCYREHKYIVRGGSGNYDIEALQGSDISATWGQKDTLKLTANYPIWGSIRLVDDMNNSIDLNFNVDYLTQRYRVDSIYSEIKGDLLRVKDIKDIEAKVKAAAESGVGSTFIFIYNNAEDKQCGEMHITDHQAQVMANMKFKAEPEVTVGTSNMTYQTILVYDLEKIAHKYSLTKEYSAEKRLQSVKMTEDVRSQFENESYYDNIESVNLYYDLTDIVKE